MVLYHSPDYQTSFKSIDLSVQKKFNTDFQDGGHGGILGFPIKTTIASFDLQVSLIRPMKCGSGEKNSK